MIDLKHYTLIYLNKTSSTKHSYMRGLWFLLQGCKVFCLQHVSVATIDVPQSSSMNRYLDKGDIQSAYQVACLGVTDSDWRTLALAALQVRVVQVQVNTSDLQQQ